MIFQVSNLKRTRKLQLPLQPLQRLNQLSRIQAPAKPDIKKFPSDYPIFVNDIVQWPRDFVIQGICRIIRINNRCLRIQQFWKACPKVRSELIGGNKEKFGTFSCDRFIRLLQLYKLPETEYSPTPTIKSQHNFSPCIITECPTLSVLIG